jgi:hypothetical protein
MYSNRSNVENRVNWLNWLRENDYWSFWELRSWRGSGRRDKRQRKAKNRTKAFRKARTIKREADPGKEKS